MNWVLIFNFTFFIWNWERSNVDWNFLVIAAISAGISVAAGHLLAMPLKINLAKGHWKSLRQGRNITLRNCIRTCNGSSRVAMEHPCQPLTVMTWGKKAIAAVRRGEAKKTWARCGWTLAATPWTGGWNERRKLGTVGQSPTINREVGTKSWTGRDLVSFPESMEVTRKQKGLSLWGDKVTQQNLSDALAKIRWSRKKKDLRVSRRRWTQAPSISTTIEDKTP